jgi:hypothetical protein
LTDPEDGSDHRPVTGTLSADWTAGDRGRFGAAFSRFAVVSFRTFPDKITGESYGAFFEGRPDWLTRIRLNADYARYASVGTFDRNHRWNVSVFASRQVWAPIRLRAGASGRYLDFERYQDNGIWTPDEFRALAGTLEWDWGSRGAWSLNGGAELGPARESGAETAVFAAWHLGLFRAVGPLLFDLSVGHSEGNVETWTGYDRTWVHAGVRRRL